LDKPAVIADWELFCETMPYDDFVSNFINRDSVVYHVPLKDELFGSLCPINNRISIEPVIKVSRKNKKDDVRKGNSLPFSNFDPAMFNSLPIQKARSTASVVHSGNMNLQIPPPREIISDDAIPSNPAELQAQFYKYIAGLKPDPTITIKRVTQLLKKADENLKTTGNKAELVARLFIICQ
jgi:hypothetical protein